MKRVMIGISPGWVAGLALAAALLGCGRAEEPAVGTAERWPVTIDEPGVLGYIVLRSLEGGLVDDAASTIGWDAAGLDETRAPLVLHLDASVHGGDLALVLPVSDEDAFVDSLEQCPSIVALGRDRYRVSLEESHPVVSALRGVSRMSAGGSPIDAITAMAQEQRVELLFTLQLVADRALLAPSFEAAVVARDALRSIGGLSQPGQQGFVVSLDLDRIKAAHQEELSKLRDQLRAILLGVSTGGVAAMLMERESSPTLPANGPFLWALVEMLGIGNVDAIQLQLDVAEGVSIGAAFAEALDAPGETDAEFECMRLDLHFAPDSHQASLSSTLRPCPDVPESSLTLSVDSAAFAAAATEWMRPIGELVMGAGPPCDRYLAELATLLEPWSGTVALLGTDDPVLAFTTFPGAVIDVDGLSGWWSRLSDAAGFAMDTEEVDWSAVEGQQHDAAFVLAAADSHPADTLRRVEPLTQAVAPSEGPAVQLLMGEHATTLSAEGARVRLELRRQRP